MTTTLYAYLNSLPELAGRVFMDTAPAPPATPFAIIYDAPGNVEVEVFGGGDVGRVFPRVTLYDKPAPGENPAKARVRLMRLADKAGQAIRYVNTHSDGSTTFTDGSFRRTNVPAPRPDENVAGQSFTTLMFTALIDRP